MHYGPHDSGGGDKAEKGQEQLADAAAEGHTEGHAYVLDEMELAPRADKGYLLPYLKVCLYPYLKRLVGDEDDRYDKGDDESLFFCGGH